MQSPTHSSGIIPISLSKLLERLGYYGIRSILLLYMVKQLQISQETSSYVYGVFTVMAMGFPIIGGIISDFVLSKKTTTIIGGFIQATGCFILAIPFLNAIYVGLFMIALGTGLYNPNIISTLGLMYKNRNEKLDSAMLIFYTCINIGAFLAPLIIGTAGEYLNYQIGFILAGILFIGSPLILLLNNSVREDLNSSIDSMELESTSLNTSTIIDAIELEKEKSTPLNTLIILATIFSIPIFWIIYQFANTPVYDRILQIGEKSTFSFASILSLINPIAIFVIGIILVIIFSFVKISSLLKIFIGFVIYALSCLMLSSFYHIEMVNSFMFFILFTTILQAIAELFISPIALSVICQYGQKKYSATLLGIYLTGNSVCSFLTSYLMVYMNSLGATNIFLISFGITIILASVFLILHFISKKKKVFA